MTLTGELRILDDKILQSCIKANQAQYELDREAAKISELWSKDLDKYTYLNGGDLGYKPGVVERAKFQYSPLGEALKKAFKKYDKDNNNFTYDSGYNFNKYNASSFNKIT